MDLFGGGKHALLSTFQLPGKYELGVSWRCESPSSIYQSERLLWGERVSRRFPGETFSNPGIQLPCNGIELLLRVQGEVGSLWQVIAEQSIGVFANPPLPGRVGMSEVDGDVCCFCQCFVEAHLAALVVRHGKSHLAFKAFEDGAKAFSDRVCSCVRQLY